MKNLTIQIINSCEGDIQKTLNSIKTFDGKMDIEIVFGDIAEREYRDRSELRNELITQTNWQMYFNSGETLAYGSQDILKAINGPIASYRLPIFQGDIITKQIRLWHIKRKLKFSNPIFECLIDKDAKDLNSIIYSTTSISPKTLEYIKRWKEQYPTSPEPYYYEACVFLSQKKYNEFLSAASLYLFRDKKKQMPVTMTRYYCAMVYCYVKKDAEQAIKNLLPCLVVKPLMSEFWCLLGDVYYHLLKKYKKAVAFYENALILGQNRLQSDDWPMEINKYKAYPLKMKESCEKAISNTRHMGITKPHLAH